MSLQWRAGQSSGQTLHPAGRPLVAGIPSMEGRTIVRPDEFTPTYMCVELAAFNGGPDNRPARPVRADHRGSGIWPSMEGRTIVRPDDESPLLGAVRLRAFNGGPDNRPARRHARPVRHHREAVPSMEGRTIVRPDVDDPVHVAAQRGPSMEGRTIVRPDMPLYLPILLPIMAFNGGPDNRPARPGIRGRAVGATVLPSMEGRTIVRPDQVPPTVYFVVHLPSMEGRTIVRPDPPEEAPPSPPAQPFNGGPDNRPARPERFCETCAILLPFNGGPDNRPARRPVASRTASSTPFLQWRAGQSSGQTGTEYIRRLPVIRLQWRAGQSSGQTSSDVETFKQVCGPSMEGRTIVRPDPAPSRCGIHQS